MVRFITARRSRSNSNSRIVEETLGPVPVFHIVASWEFPNDWAVLPQATSRQSVFVNPVALSETDPTGCGRFCCSPGGRGWL
jgi:hypothetical protein